MSVQVRERKWRNAGKKKIGKAKQVDINFQTADGVKHRKRFSFEGTATDASEWGQRALEALRAGKPVPPQHATNEEVDRTESFETFARTFLKTHAVNNKPSERRSKEIIIEKHLIPYFGKLTLQQIGISQIDGFKSRLVDTLDLSPKTTNNCLIVLRTILGKAAEYGRLAAIPRVKRLKVEKPDVRAFTTSQATQLLGCIGPEWRVMLLVALRTGLRIGELRGLQWDDVDFAGSRLHIRRSFSRNILGTPKNGKSRSVPLSKDAVTALRQHQHARGKFVFCGNGGEPFEQDEVYPPLHAALAAVGIGDEDWRPGWHSCRHTFVSWLVQQGVPLNVVKELAGHSDISMTLRYAHFAPAEMSDAVGRLDACHKMSVTTP